VRIIKEKIVERHGRVEDVRLFNLEPSEEQLSMKQMPQIVEEEPKEEEDHKQKKNQDDSDAEPNEQAAPKEKVKENPISMVEEFVDETQYLYNIFKDNKLPGFTPYGFEDKEKADECPVKVYYDFHPFNNKDPVLLTLMVTPPKSLKFD
jgi:hypothetical protein